ncbi:hypothetical protein GQ457_15G013310 [Hibiscus cannabinus]
MVFDYRYSIRVSIPKVSEYRYPKSSIDTLCCISAFIAGRKLPNGSIDDLTYQNGWKSVRGYKNKLLKLQQYQEHYPRAKIKFKSSFVLNLQTLVTQFVFYIPIHSVLWSCTEAAQSAKAQKASKQKVGPVFPTTAEGRIKQERDKSHQNIFNIPKEVCISGEAEIKSKSKDLKPKHIKYYLECKFQPKKSESAEKSAQAGPVVSCRDNPFVIQFKQIIEAPR